jgi:tetrahydromethanopterin S-methyltransferase subunit B
VTSRDWNPIGYRVHTNTWAAYGERLPVDEVLRVLDRVDAHFDAAMQSLQPTTPEVES